MRTPVSSRQTDFLAEVDRTGDAGASHTADLFGDACDTGDAFDTEASVQMSTSRDHYRQALAAAHAMRGQRGKRRKVRQGQAVCSHLIGMLQAARDEQARH